jgi:hypothetical protein
VVSWLRVGPTTKPSHHEAIPANNYASPASAGLFNHLSLISLNSFTFGL